MRHFVNVGALRVVRKEGLATSQLKRSRASIVDLNTLATTAVFFSRLRVVIAKRIVSAPKNFERITHAIAICVFKTIERTVVVFLRIETIPKFLCVDGVVVACHWICASIYLQTVANAIFILIQKTPAFAIETEEVRQLARSVVKRCVRIVIASQNIRATQT